MAINWLTPYSVGGKKIADGCDVLITAGKSKEHGEHLRIKFDLGSYKKITDIERIIIGIAGDKMYFAESTSGYKLSHNKTEHSDVRSVCIRSSRIDFVGSYVLKFDEAEGLYFIAKTDRQFRDKVR